MQSKHCFCIPPEKKKKIVQSCTKTSTRLPPPSPHARTQTYTQDSHYSCCVKNKYLLTGGERAATACPHPAGKRLDTSWCSPLLQPPAPLPGQIEHVILCSHLISPSHPVTEDTLLLQWRERKRWCAEAGEVWGGGKSGHTFLHTHPRVHAQSRQADKESHTS